MLAGPQAPPAPSPELQAESRHAAQLAQKLLQQSQISLSDAILLRLSLCVPVSIGQVSRCVPVIYSTPGPTSEEAAAGT